MALLSDFLDGFAVASLPNLCDRLQKHRGLSSVGKCAEHQLDTASRSSSLLARTSTAREWADAADRPPRRPHDGYQGPMIDW